MPFPLYQGGTRGQTGMESPGSFQSTQVPDPALRDADMIDLGWGLGFFFFLFLKWCPARLEDNCLNWSPTHSSQINHHGVTLSTMPPITEGLSFWTMTL